MINTLDDGSTVSIDLHRKIIADNLLSGVSANQANRAHLLESQTITSGNTVDISLYSFEGFDIGAGEDKDGLGHLLALEEIVLLVLKQTSGTGRLEVMPTVPTSGIRWIPENYLTVANAGALKTGGVHLMYQPDTDAFDVINGESEFLRLGANGGSVTFDLLVIARHDDDESSSSSTSSLSSSSSSSGSSLSSSSSPSTSSTSSQSTEELYSSSSST